MHAQVWHRVNGAGSGGVRRTFAASRSLHPRRLGHHLENFFQWSRLHVLTVNLPVFWAPSRLRVFLVANGDVNGRAVIRIVAG
jgi:hypothetical protein